MVDRLTITVVVDNLAGKPEFKAEHGLSLWVETPGFTFLLDAGRGEAFAHNLKALGMEGRELNAVVLSHGHYDHTGGLPAVLERWNSVPVYLHPEAVLPRYSRRNESPPRSIGMPSESAVALNAHLAQAVWTQSPTPLGPGSDIWVSGSILRGTHEDESRQGFFLDAACTEPDPVRDDQAVWISTPRGLVVLLGCAHSGVVNTLDHIERVAGEQPVHSLAGGFHLGGALRETLEVLAERLDRLKVRWIFPAHCTGETATTYLQKRFPDRTRIWHSGDRLSLLPEATFL